MSLTEQTRLRLHQYLEEHMDRRIANEVMEWLPRGELATRDDIEALRLATKAEIEGLRAEMSAEFAGVRADVASEFAGVRTEMASEFASVRAEMASEFASVRADAAQAEKTLALRIDNIADKLRAEFHRDIRTHTLVLVGATATINAMMVSAAKLL